MSVWIHFQLALLPLVCCSYYKWYTFLLYLLIAIEQENYWFHLISFSYLISTSVNRTHFFLVRIKFNSLEFSGNIIISSEDNNNIFSSFPVVMPYIPITFWEFWTTDLKILKNKYDRSFPVFYILLWMQVSPGNFKLIIVTSSRFFILLNWNLKHSSIS